MMQRTKTLWLLCSLCNFPLIKQVHDKRMREQWDAKKAKKVADIEGEADAEKFKARTGISFGFFFI